jgi:hypothetical protein
LGDSEHNAVELTRIPAIFVKGKTRPVDIYRVG